MCCLWLWRLFVVAQSGPRETVIVNDYVVGKAVTVAVSAFFKEFLNMGEIDVLHHVPFIALGRQFVNEFSEIGETALNVVVELVY